MKIDDLPTDKTPTMPLAHTPRKRTAPEANSPVDREKAGPSPQKPTTAPNVRKSIGEWEGSKGNDPKTVTSVTYLVSPKNQVRASAAQPGPAQKATLIHVGKDTKRRGSVEATGGSPGPLASVDRAHEGRVWLLRAKTHLNDSRNLRADLKAGITQAVEAMYRLIKDGASETVNSVKGQKTCNVGIGEQGKEKGEQDRAIGKNLEEDANRLTKTIEEHSKLLRESNRRMEELKSALDEQREIQATSKEVPSYAKVAQARSSGGVLEKRNTLHSVVVTSKDESETGEEVLDKVRKAVDAKEGWIKVERIRKAKNRKVVMGFETEEERDKVKDRLEREGIDLTVEAVKNRDPMLILRDVLVVNTDEDILKALRNQNRDVFRGLCDGDDRLEIKYRRKTRNPHSGHVVVGTSPVIWQRVITRGHVHIDLQRVRAEDQTPLIQCTRCLGYGHGRKYCTETMDVCSHCGGPHLKTECSDWIAGGIATCRNCKKANMPNMEHNAFSLECPVRRKWDALARSTTAYC